MVVLRAIVAGGSIVGCGPVVAQPSADTDGATTTTGTTVEPPLDTATSTPGTSIGTTEPGTVATSVDPSDATTDPGLDVGGSCGGFECPDGGNLITECDVWSHDCPDGEKCTAWANDGGDRWNATRCVPIYPNPGLLGDECVVEGTPTSGIDDCSYGLMCFHVDPETNTGTCVALCEGSEMEPLCGDGATTCTISNEGTLILCLPSCDPLQQNCAHDGDACTPTYYDDFACFPVDQPSASAGEPCEYPDSCVAGTVCMPGDRVVGCMAESCCAPFCDDTLPDADASCPGSAEGEHCQPWFDPIQVPDPPPQPIGVCVLPG